MGLVSRLSPTIRLVNAMTDAPKIEFPCAYPLKVVGNAADDFRDWVAEVLERHAGPVAGDQFEVVASRNGRFLSVRATIVATGETQLRAIFDELKASGRVHMVI
jgi:putative lipoic acid-binding regulatory protein